MKRFAFALIGVFALLLASPALADEGIVLRLPAEREVTGDQVCVGDLSLDPVPAALAEQVVMPAPAAGHDRRLSRELLRRLMVQAGVRPLPRLGGADSIRLVRAGRVVDAGAVEAAVLAQLGKSPLPEGALDQRFEVGVVPDVFVAPGPFRVVLEDEPPRVGRGAVRVRIEDSAGRVRRVHVPVRREVYTQVWVTGRELEASTPLTATTAATREQWIDDRGLFDTMLPVRGELDGSATLVRTVRGGEILRARDLRATPVVRRGEPVKWTIQRGEITVCLEVRARGNGAPGDWILVENPLDGRLRRVCVVGPGAVSEHPPSLVTSRSEP